MPKVRSRILRQDTGLFRVLAGEERRHLSALLRKVYERHIVVPPSD